MSDTPATDWLADLAGVSPEELRRDPAALARATAFFGRLSIDLLRDLVSDDEVTRTNAAAHCEALRATFPADERGSDGATEEVKRPVLNRLLRDVVSRLEAAAEKSRRDQASPD